MMIIVGLGNPGKKYINTRHNVGFKVAEELLKRKKAGWILFKTKTFMNQSGEAVKKIMARSKCQTANLVIIHDDIDILIGEFKMQKDRGSAGHKGVQSIIKELGTNSFWRIRIGICPQNAKPKNVEKFVLEKLTKNEEKNIKELVEKIAKEIESKNQ